MVSEKPWKPEAVLMLFGALFASISLGMFLALWLGLGGETTSSNIPQFSSFAIGTLTFHGVAVLLISRFLRKHETGWVQAFGFKSPQLGRTLLWAVAGGLLALPVAWGLSEASARFMELFRVKPVAQQAVQMLQGNRAMPWMQQVVFGVVAMFLAPVVEEMLFRGILFPTLKQAGFRRLAWWGPSLFFAAIHVNLMIFVPLTFLAFLLTWLYERTDNLLCPIVAHSLFNSINFLGLVFSFPPFNTGR